jgi:hypothetical protein
MGQVRRYQSGPNVTHGSTISGVARPTFLGARSCRRAGAVTGSGCLVCVLAGNAVDVQQGQPGAGATPNCRSRADLVVPGQPVEVTPPVIAMANDPMEIDTVLRTRRSGSRLVTRRYPSVLVRVHRAPPVESLEVVWCAGLGSGGRGPHGRRLGDKPGALGVPVWLWAAIADRQARWTRSRGRIRRCDVEFWALAGQTGRYRVLDCVLEQGGGRGG